MNVPRLRFFFLAIVAIFAASCATPHSSGVLPTTAVLRLQPAESASSIQVPFTHPTGDFYVNVSVGGGRKSQVVFDAGSIGMHIIAARAGKGIRRTTTPFTNAYGSGTIYSGVMGYGPVTIGGISTSSKTPVGLIEKIYCMSSKPNCPGKSGIPGAIKAGRLGVMGVRFSGFTTGVAFDSPLGYLPSPYDRGFVVTRDTLYLGLPSAVRKSFQTVHLTQLPGRNGSGFRAWENSIPMTWKLGGHILTGSTIKTLFDTGTSAYIMTLPAGTIRSQKVENGTLVSGLKLRVLLPAAFNFKLTSGTDLGVNLVTVAAASSPSSASVNTGWSPFNSYDVMYDPVNGLMGFRPHL